MADVRELEMEILRADQKALLILAEALRNARRTHTAECWSGHGATPVKANEVCDCGTDVHNAKIDNALERAGSVESAPARRPLLPSLPTPTPGLGYHP